MTEDTSPQDQLNSTPNSALRALEIMIGTWGLEGRDFTTNEAIRRQSTFEWLEGGFFVVHRFSIDYAGRRFAGVEYIGYDEKSGLLKTHVYLNQGGEPIVYTWDVDDETFTNWFGKKGSSNRYKGKFSEDHNTLVGQQGWPGGGCAATLTKASCSQLVVKRLNYLTTR